jgi:hypothetical protein
MTVGEPNQGMDGGKVEEKKDSKAYKDPSVSIVPCRKASQLARWMDTWKRAFCRRGRGTLMYGLGETMCG